MTLYKLKEEYREPLRVPIGIALYRPPKDAVRIIQEIIELFNPPLLVTVGDAVTLNLALAGLKPNIAVIDGRTMRRSVDNTVLKRLLADYEVMKCINPPGTLSKSSMEIAMEAIRRATSSRSVLVTVEGEEDLLALPLIASAPRGSIVVYGLWRGAAVVTICHPYLARRVSEFLDKAFEEATG